MDENRRYFTDTVGSTLTYVGEGDTVDADFDPSDATTVTRDDGWVNFFDTDEFVQFTATVAQPLIQPYVHNGELQQFRKTDSELKKAQPQIENLPWTMGHPPQDRVTTASQIRGVWTDPRWNDGQDATLHIPADDDEAVRYAVHNDEVSIGFGGHLDWADDDAVEYDATQRDIAYDHIASVETGRCPPDQGCGLHTDGVHGHTVTDAVRTQETETGDVSGTADWDVGDFVVVTRDDTRVHGRVVAIEGDDVMVQPYDESADRFNADAMTVSPASLTQWVGPHADSCPGAECTCGCHTDATHDDAPAGIYVSEDGGWYGISPDETADDDPKYELDNCNDVKDAFNLRNNGDYDIDTSTLVTRIKRVSDVHDCPPEQTPWTDGYAAATLAQALNQTAD